MASIGTANTTLTLAALCFRSAESIARDLRSNEAPAGMLAGGRA